MKTTQSNWGYGLRLSSWWDAKFVSTDYHVVGDTIEGIRWLNRNNSRLYEIIHNSADIVVSRYYNKFKMSIGAGAVFTHYSFWNRLQVDEVLTHMNYVDNIGNPSSLSGGILVKRGGKSFPGLMLVNIAHFEYEVNTKVHIGVSFRYLPRRWTFAKYTRWQQGDGINDFVEFNVKEDKLKMGFSIGYQFSKKHNRIVNDKN